MDIPGSQIDETKPRRKWSSPWTDEPPEVFRLRPSGWQVAVDPKTGELDIAQQLSSHQLVYLERHLASLRRAPRVRSVRLMWVGHSELPPRFGDDVICSIPPASPLRSLGIDGGELSDVALERIIHFSQLETLDLNRTNCTAAGLAKFASLKHLSTLVLSVVDIPVTVLAALVDSLVNLKELSLNYSSLSPFDINNWNRFASDLKKLPSLQTLKLSYTLIADEAIPFLAELPALRSLQLYGSAVTAAGTTQLKRRCPDLKIEWFPPVHRVGYWPDQEIDPRLIDPQWEPNRRGRIIQYLEQAPAVAWLRCNSDCHYGCGHIGCAEHSDGQWIWHACLAHHVQTHNLRLPDAFVDYMQQHGFRPPHEIYVYGRSDVTRRTSDAFWDLWCWQQTSRLDPNQRVH